MSEKRQPILDYEHREDGTYVVYFHPRALRLLPPETHAHMRAARREMLLAWRSLLDAAIQRMEQAEPGAAEPHKIEVT